MEKKPAGVQKTVGVYERPAPRFTSPLVLAAVAVVSAAAVTGALIYFF